jgi:hypothetical protein
MLGLAWLGIVPWPSTDKAIRALNHQILGLWNSIKPALELTLHTPQDMIPH